MPIRARLALVVLVVATALVAAGVLLLRTQLRAGLLDSVEQSLEAEAAPVASYVASAPAVDAGRLRALMRAQREAVAQVVSPTGTMVFSSAGTDPVLSRCPEKLHCAAAGDPDATGKLQRVAFTAAPPGGTAASPDRYLATSVRRSDGTWLVVVGTSLSDTDAAIGHVQATLLIGGGLAIALAVVGAWVLGGAALRPVERMRREVAAISEHDPARAIEVPGTRDELAALAGTMNGLLARLSGALARERRFVADASHELRTPLTVLRTGLELASRRDRTREELTDAVAHASAEAARLSRLADDLLFLARVDEGVPVLRATEQELGPAVAGALQAWEQPAAGRGVRLSLGLEPGLRAWFDPDRLRQAIDNLVDNALRFAPSGSALEVGTVGSGNFAVLRVADRGEGFPPEFLPHAFERFNRPDSARSQEEGGSGLGLAVTAAIARAHGGWVAARNREGGGAVVDLGLRSGPGGQ